jgi:glucose dehydrogenase
MVPLSRIVRRRGRRLRTWGSAPQLVYNELMLLRNGMLWLVMAVMPLCASDWLMFGGDPQRTGWAQGEKDINRGNAKDLTLLWKASLDNAPRELNSLTAAVGAEWVVTPKGMKEIVIVGGASDNLYALDAETGKLIWKKTFTPDSKPSKSRSGFAPTR